MKLLRRIFLGLLLVIVIAGALLLNGPVREYLSDRPDPQGWQRFAENQAVAGGLVGAQQVVFVTSERSDTFATVTGYGLRSDGTWSVQRGPYTARIGGRGFVAADQRQEQTDTTPAGTFLVTGAFGATDPPEGTVLPYDVLLPTDCWISVPTDPAYNRWVVRDDCGAGNVAMYDRRAGIFRTAIMFDFNADPVVANRGSAIFIHAHATADGEVVRDDNGDPAATYGGVALANDDVRALVRWLDPEKNPRLVMGNLSQFPAPLPQVDAGSN